VSAGVGGLILAGGAGRRFRATPKQLAELDGQPLLVHAIEAQWAVPALERIVVVLGARAEEIQARIDFSGVEVVVASDWEEGAAASLRAGVAALADCRAVIVTLGDQPLITPQVIVRFLDERGPARASYDGVPGHPVKLTPALMRRVAGLHGDVGGRELLRGARLVECGHLCLPDDVDTAEDLARVAAGPRVPATPLPIWMREGVTP